MTTTEVLHRAKCEERLHYVEDRTEMIERARDAARTHRATAAHFALEALRSEAQGSFGSVGVNRASALRYLDYAERFDAIALWMIPNPYLDCPRVAPYESEAKKALFSPYEEKANGEFFASLERIELARAQRMLDAVRIARSLHAEPGTDVSSDDVLRVLKLDSDVYEKLRWLFSPGDSDKRVVVDRPCACDVETALQVSHGRLHERVVCAECRTVWAGFAYPISGLRRRIGFSFPLVKPIDVYIEAPIAVTPDIAKKIEEALKTSGP